jgi:hypothetical protein
VRTQPSPQLDLFDTAILARLLLASHELLRIAATVDWAYIDADTVDLYGPGVGRPAYPAQARMSRCSAPSTHERGRNSGDRQQRRRWFVVVSGRERGRWDRSQFTVEPSVVERVGVAERGVFDIFQTEHEPARRWPTSWCGTEGRVVE